MGHALLLSNEPLGTRFIPLQNPPGGSVSTIVTTCEQIAVRPQRFVTCQVRMAKRGQVPFVTVLVTYAAMPGSQQVLTMAGVSNPQPLPHWTVLFDGQTSVSIGFGGGTTIN